MFLWDTSTRQDIHIPEDSNIHTHTYKYFLTKADFLVTHHPGKVILTTFCNMKAIFLFHMLK
jgi:hypothetical protein